MILISVLQMITGRECQISKRTYQAQQNRQNQKDQVEIGKYIIMNNLFCRKSRGATSSLVQPFSSPYPDLLGIKTYPVVWNHTLDLAANDFFLLCFFFFFPNFIQKSSCIHVIIRLYGRIFH